MEELGAFSPGLKPDIAKQSILAGLKTRYPGLMLAAARKSGAGTELGTTGGDKSAVAKRAECAWLPLKGPQAHSQPV